MTATTLTLRYTQAKPKSFTMVLMKIAMKTRLTMI